MIATSPLLLLTVLALSAFGANGFPYRFTRQTDGTDGMQPKEQHDVIQDPSGAQSQGLEQTAALDNADNNGIQVTHKETDSIQAVTFGSNSVVESQTTESPEPMDNQDSIFGSQQNQPVMKEPMEQDVGSSELIVESLTEAQRSHLIAYFICEMCTELNVSACDRLCNGGSVNGSEVVANAFDTEGSGEGSGEDCGDTNIIIIIEEGEASAEEPNNDSHEEMINTEPSENAETTTASDNLEVNGAIANGIIIEASTSEPVETIDSGNVGDVEKNGNEFSNGLGKRASDGEAETTTPGDAQTTTSGEDESTTSNAETTTPGDAETTTTGDAETTTSVNAETTTPGDAETTTAGDAETTTSSAAETTTPGDAQSTTSGSAGRGKRAISSIETTTSGSAETSTSGDPETTTSGDAKATTTDEHYPTSETTTSGNAESTTSG